MANLQQLEERKQELLNELSTYKWWGNEDDEDYLDEFGEEYEDLQTELNGVQEQIWEVSPKEHWIETEISSIEDLQKFILKNK